MEPGTTVNIICSIDHRVSICNNLKYEMCKGAFGFHPQNLFFTGSEGGLGGPSDPSRIHYKK